jgi:hypothetical protein
MGRSAPKRVKGYIEMELKPVCCQNLTLGTLSVLDVALFKKVGIFLNTPHSTQHLRLRTIIMQLVVIKVIPNRLYGVYQLHQNFSKCRGIH